tara:strand:- start:764 stop:1042 length:279 start_codon:yes stop_codon:yes gene_type:complete
MTLLEAIDWLAREILIDKSLERLFRSADKIKPGISKPLMRLSAGAQAGIIVGSALGRRTQRNLAKGIPFAALERTPGVARYEDSAIRSTRLL